MIAAIAIGDLFAAGEVAWIMAIGAILEERTTEKAKKGLKKLISLACTDTYLKRVSNATVKTIKFSIGLSMCINIIAVTLSVMGILNPTTGALVHNAGSCFVVLIAALLYDRKFE